MLLSPGRVHPPWLAHEGGTEVIDRWARADLGRRHGERDRTGGIVDIPHDIAVSGDGQTRDELPQSARLRAERVGRRRLAPEPIKGPSALGGDTRRFVHLARTLAVRSSSCGSSARCSATCGS